MPVIQYFVVILDDHGGAQLIGRARHEGGGALGWPSIEPAITVAAQHDGAKIAKKIDGGTLTIMPSD